jgi:hypothetical protein
MSKISKLLERLSKVRAKVARSAKYDKLNLSDDTRTRSPLATQTYKKNIDNMVKVLRTDVDSVLKTDINLAASLEVQEFVFKAKDLSRAGNNLYIQFLDEGLEAVKVVDNVILISFEDGVTTHDDVKLLIETSLADSLVSVEVNAGEELSLVTATESLRLSGAR